MVSRRIGVLGPGQRALEFVGQIFDIPVVMPVLVGLGYEVRDFLGRQVAVFVLVDLLGSLVVLLGNGHNLVTKADSVVLDGGGIQALGHPCRRYLRPCSPSVGMSRVAAFSRKRVNGI